MNIAARASARDRTAFASSYFLSSFGYEVLFFAMTLRVYDISRKAINVGVFAAITFLPKLLSPAYGAIVDRFGTRRSIAVAAVAVAALSLPLPALGSIWALYALWLPLSALFMLISNARTVLMTQVSGPGGYVGANSATFGLMNASRLTAPLCAGLLSKSIGPGGVVAVSSIAYALCAALAASLSGARFRGRLHEPGPARPGRARPSLAASYLEGFSKIAASAELRLLVGVSMIRSFFTSFMQSLLVVIFVGRLGGSNADYGLAMTAAALGSLAGSLGGPIAAKAAPRRAVAAAGLGAYFACLAALGLVGSLGAAVGLLAAGSFALYSAAIVLHSMRDAAASAESRGRVYGANTAVQTVSSLVSLLAGGALADRFGVGPAFAASGAAALAVLAAVSIRVAARRRSPRRPS
jgi:MFS transporter, DHA3 family, macrolide efflux protein